VTRARPAAVAGRVAALAALALLALGALFALERLQRADALRITAVEIHGLRGARVDAGAVREVVEAALPATYFSIDLRGLEARIESLPWVFGAKLRRRWPDTLIVQVAQVQPVATWGEAHWLHSTGDLVARPAEADGDAKWRDLPRLSGPGEGARAGVWRAYRTWSKAFAAHGLHLDEWHVDARGLAYLELSVSALAARDGGGGDGAGGDGGVAGGVAGAGGGAVGAAQRIRITVPVEVADARLARFARALRQLLREDFAALRTVDLRYPNGFAVSRAAAPAGVTSTSATATAVAKTPAEAK